MNFNLNNESDPWEFGLDIDDFDLHLTSLLRFSSSTRVEPSPLTPNPVRIIPGHAVLFSSLVTHLLNHLPSFNVGEDEDFKSEVWVSATDYVNANGGTEKYNYGSQTHIGGSSSTHDKCNIYLTEEEPRQLHSDEEALRETLEEGAKNEKEREKKIKQKQADDEEF
nr:hypothetical protein [Tanacetum cinerariifolium]